MKHNASRLGPALAKRRLGVREQASVQRELDDVPRFSKVGGIARVADVDERLGARRHGQVELESTVGRKRLGGAKRASQLSLKTGRRRRTGIETRL
jgi:hypothetical protein